MGSKFSTAELAHFNRPTRWLLRYFPPQRIMAIYVLTICIVFTVEEHISTGNRGVQALMDFTGVHRHIWILGGLLVVLLLTFDSRRQRIVTYHWSVIGFLSSVLVVAYRGQDVWLYLLTSWYTIMNSLVILAGLMTFLALHDIVDKALELIRITNNYRDIVDERQIEHG